MSDHVPGPKTKRVPNDAQRGFSFAGELGPVRPPAPGEIRNEALAAFAEGNRYLLWVGNVPLEKYLVDRGLQWVIELERRISQTDLLPLMEAYRFGGRPPIHPRVMVGLIVYGMLTRRWSLRELELVSQTDVCAWYLTGGLQPDHSTIGKFIVMHSKALTKEYFEALIRRIAKELGFARGDGALDGTVIESAASHFTTLQREAAEAQATKATAEAQQAGDAGDQRKAAAAAKVAQVLSERAKARAIAGKSPEKVQVAPSDVEAVVQPLKNGTVRPAYKPSVLANSQRVIVGQVVEPSSETTAVKPLLEQYEVVHGGAPETLLLDAGYHSGALLREQANRGTNILCPEGKAKGHDDYRKAGKGRQFPKSAFVYDEQADVYRCPWSQLLTPMRFTERDAQGREYRRYRTAACAQCPMAAQCFSGKKGRSIKRYADDEYKDAMSQVFTQPAARDHYRKRKAMVEPVFAELKERQGLRRFRRRGLVRVSVEFALHCIAYNFKRVIALARAAAQRAAPVAFFAALSLALLAVTRHKGLQPTSRPTGPSDRWKRCKPSTTPTAAWSFA